MEKFDIFESLIRYYGSAYLVVDKTKGTCTGIADKYYQKDNQVVLVFNPLTQPAWHYEDGFLSCTLVFEGNRTSVFISQEAVVATYALYNSRMLAQVFFSDELDDLFKSKSPSTAKTETTSESSDSETKSKIKKLFPRK